MKNVQYCEICKFNLFTYQLPKHLSKQIAFSIYGSLVSAVVHPPENNANNAIVDGHILKIEFKKSIIGLGDSSNDADENENEIRIAGRVVRDRGTRPVVGFVRPSKRKRSFTTKDDFDNMEEEFKFLRGALFEAMEI
ncbi:hypothetical protein HK098_003145 [Nowakowskiella sp. JEL0407]|nr:hypothetical protein HK098_003145 [Nowakowskiella sp. JEL0407]